MAEMKVYLSDELDKRFRKEAMTVYGYGKGSISKAAQEAFLEWCRKHEATREPAREQAGPTLEAIDAKPGIALEDKNEQHPSKMEQVSNDSRTINSSTGS